MWDALAFIVKNLSWIWLVAVIFICCVLSFIANRLLGTFQDPDSGEMIYSPKSVSGLYTKSFIGRQTGVGKILHILITDKELILKTNVGRTFISKKNGLLHRVPLQNLISTDLKTERDSSNLIVKFRGAENKEKEVVLLSEKNWEIKEILDRYVQ